MNIMGRDYTKSDVSRRVPDNEKLTVQDYVLKCFPLTGCTFQRGDGKIYTVKKQEMDFKTGPFVITTKGTRLNIQGNLGDKELNLSEIIGNENNRI